MLVLLLHLLLLLGLLRSLTAPIKSPHATAREMILRLLPLLKSAPAENAAPPAVASPQLRSRIVPVVPPPGSAPAPSLSGLGQSLFGCAPENLSTLSREQRAHCATGLARPDDSVMAEPPSHVKDPARRAAEMRTKNTPGRIPCTYIAVDKGEGHAVPAVDPLCVLDGLINGFGPLNGLGK
ncbi:MAG: hypothetical protein JWP16_555 [Alphaproteobacteria bacterium]|jgi:hypothetical protein|nr:hypothetical protein [Alphaproteobacteria bacterium]MDB5739515.1 hypothetical protein [Alphaproteobacteria bacterium]